MPMPEREVLFSLVYEELRRLAYSVKRNRCIGDPQSHGLVREAWLKLENSPRFLSTSPVQFKRIAARAMRQVLSKRRGVAIPASVEGPRTGSVRRSAGTAFLFAGGCMTPDEALQEVGRLHPRQAARTRTVDIAQWMK